MRYASLTALFVLLLAWAALSRSTELSQPLVLVATPELRDPVYGASVLVVTPIGNDQHLGFIVNRPTAVTLGKVFPEHAPSQKIVDPVYLGGPVDVQAIFALVQRPQSPGGSSVQIMPGLFATLDAATVDRIIESGGSRARFVAGLVLWRPGELDAEIRQGAWLVREPDASLVTRNPDGLWEELVRLAGRIRA